MVLYEFQRFSVIFDFHIAWPDTEHDAVKFQSLLIGQLKVSVIMIGPEFVSNACLSFRIHSSYKLRNIA